MPNQADYSQKRHREVSRDNTKIGDIIYINKEFYLCLYCDKLNTVLFKDSDEFSINNIIILPSKDSYIVVDKASKEKIEDAYNKFILYKGMFVNRDLDNVERAMGRILID